MDHKMNDAPDEFRLEIANSIQALVDQLNANPEFELVRVFDHDDNNRAYALLRRVRAESCSEEETTRYRLVRKRDYESFVRALNVQVVNGFDLSFLFDVSGDPCAIMRRLR